MRRLQLYTAAVLLVSFQLGCLTKKCSEEDRQAIDWAISQLATPSREELGGMADILGIEGLPSSKERSTAIKVLREVPKRCREYLAQRGNGLRNINELDAIGRRAQDEVELLRP